MSIADKVQNITPPFPAEDEQFQKLKEALDAYHQMIEKGTLVPRQSKVSHVYEQAVYKANISGAKKY